ncbi:T9SS type A sorting domain-containing protein [Kaistella sp. G5-32]|uniref:T9SS type A sorting domain-containing protein n=1 Tax=Kaistella gelatinilytica TaxID=2787636 RepID=A0ABS0F960_9FLAO|nr:T9SS type A sorting domain-containing protein [Kaistella gelatinilytica]MBF8456246.1 T9SS type A sorting domain-containing protein [Kaistella gelatinilytica]
MKKLFILSVICLMNFLFSQTIDFKGCIPLFENQNYTLNKTGTDSFGKNIYITTPVNGDQPCGGVGVCEFKLQWNNTSSRWEFLADQGDGDFVNPFLIYYSTTANGVGINPPNITIGTWLENTSVTTGACGGNLTNANGTMTGDVRTTVLAVNEFDKSAITIYPNPATEVINITGLDNIKNLKIFSADGKLISSNINTKGEINISKLPPGVYFVEINTDRYSISRIKFIKK